MTRHSALFDGFRSLRITTDGASIATRIGGCGPAVLLLHGYPQTQAMWHPIAHRLARTHTVVLTDLRGYGDSRAHNEDFTFRAMAGDQVAVMTELGFDTFTVIGHDRGARTTHRLVLDHTDRVDRVAFLDILPTLDVWRLMNDWLARKYYHWAFLAQPNDLPARLISHDPVFYLHRALGGLSGPLDAFAPAALAEYERCATDPQVVHAWCGDYAAAAGEDLEHDRADRGRRLDTPALVLWGSRGVVGAQEDPLTLWSTWFTDLRGGAIDAGHFLVEKEPAQVWDRLEPFLTG